MSSRISLEIRPGLALAQIDKLRADITRLTKQARFVWNTELMDDAISLVYQEVYKRTPVKTGRLRRSIVVESAPDRRIICVTAPYARFVEEGTKPSPGRYVKRIKRRLVNPSVRNPDIGMHPGTKPTWFFRKGITVGRGRALMYLREQVLNNPRIGARSLAWLRPKVT